MKGRPFDETCAPTPGAAMAARAIVEWPWVPQPLLPLTGWASIVSVARADIGGFSIFVAQHRDGRWTTSAAADGWPYLRGPWHHHIRDALLALTEEHPGTRPLLPAGTNLRRALAPAEVRAPLEPIPGDSDAFLEVP